MKNISVYNPIVAKELVQASHRRWTFVLRTCLPLLGALVILPPLLDSIGGVQDDWRRIASRVRPFFMAGMWAQIIILSLTAFMYSSSTVYNEWSNRTMEVLRAVPLSAFQIVFGKFGAALLRLLMVALALTPLMAILVHLGTIPPEMMIASFGVVVASVLFFGSSGLMQACAFRPARGGNASFLATLLPYFAALALLDGFVWVGHPILEAAIPFRALHLVLTNRGAGTLSANQFALLAFALPVAQAGLHLLVAPLLFNWTFRRHMGGRGKKPGRLKRMLGGNRGELRPQQDPLIWQERGKGTSALRWAVWLVYAVTAAFIVVFAMAGKPHENRWQDVVEWLGDDDFWFFIGWEGLVVIGAMALGYGLSIFAREKSAHRATGLLLTGRSPWQFVWAKIRAMYRAIFFPLIAVAGAFIYVAVLTFTRAHGYGYSYNHLTEEITATILFAQLIFLGPALTVIIAFPFSLTARDTARAFLGFVTTVVWGALLAWGFAIMADALDMRWYRSPGTLFISALVLLAVMLGVIRKWTAWRLGFLLAVVFWTWMTGIIACVEIMQDRLRHGILMRTPSAPLDAASLWLSFGNLAAGVVLVVFWGKARKWSVWRLGLVEAAVFGVWAAAGLVRLDAQRYDAPEFVAISVCVSVLSWLAMAFWLWVSVRVFAAGMAGEEARLFNRKVT